MRDAGGDRANPRERPIDADPEGAIRQIGSEQVYGGFREWRMRHFVEQAFVPDFIEGFAHIQQDLSLIHI